MYGGDLTPRERTGPVVAVLAVHSALAFMLLTMSGHLTPAAVEQTLKIIDVTPPVPRPPLPPPPRVSRASARPKAAAPPAKKAEATPIAADKPRVILPIPSPIVAAPVPAQGAAASQGSATAGPGTGAGGSGSGSGDDDGDGDDGTGTHPRPMFRPLNPRGFPRALVEPLPPGARVFILFTVQVDGRITDCIIRESSGTPALDALVCQVAQQRFRYEPARHGDGRPYVAKSAYMQVF